MPVPVLLEQHEVPDVIQEQLRPEEAAHDLLQLELQHRLVVPLRNRAPRHVPLLARRERADARVHPVAHHQRFVEDEQVLDLVLVRLELVNASHMSACSAAGFFSSTTAKATR